MPRRVVTASPACLPERRRLAGPVTGIVSTLLRSDCILPEVAGASRSRRSSHLLC